MNLLALDGAFVTLGASSEPEISLDFQANEEIAAIRWWDVRAALPGPVQPLDAYLARLTREWDSGLSHHQGCSG
ncbi:hypothetical protein AB0D91_48350 [Streptomyces canus]|uniref:hypothetical protein n=1 Tax=Streptomyces canus TaxID=58343 RepID=UPI0034031275